MAYIINKLKQFYFKYMKLHCPDCDGVMDSKLLDMEYDKMVYECRECGKRWM